MFKLSKQVDYALQFLSRLARAEEGETVSLRTFSEESTISFLFLQRIARQMKHAGIIVATHGKHGGYTLARPYSTITLWDVMTSLGEATIAPCLDEQKGCTKVDSCSVRHGVMHVQKQMMSLLQDTSVSSLSV